MKHSLFKKILIISGSLLTLVSIGIIVLLYCVPIPHPLLQKSLSYFFSQNYLDSCTIQSSSILIARGINAKGITLFKQTSENTSFTLSIHSVHISYNFFDMLRSLPMFYFYDEQKSDPKKNIDSLFFVNLTSMHCKGITVSLISDNQQIGTVTQADLRLDIRQHSTPLLITASLSAKTMNTSIVHLQNSTIKAVITAQRCSIPEFSGTLYDGKMKGRCVIDYSTQQIISGYVEANNVTIEKAYAHINPDKGSLQGTATMLLQLHTSSLSPDSLSGTGSLLFKNVKAQNLPALKNLSQITQINALTAIKFDSMTADYTLKNKKIQSDNIYANGSPALCTGSGWVYLFKDNMSFTIKGTVPPKYQDSLLPLAWNALYPNKDGSRSFTCTISGSFSSPVISLDKKFMIHAVNSLIQDIGKEIQNFIKK